MSLIKFNRGLLVMTLLIFAVGISILYGHKFNSGGEVGRNDVFCLACLEDTFYKSKTWEWKSPPDYQKTNELIFIPAEVGISERALLFKVLHSFSAMKNYVKTRDHPLSSFVAQFFTTWGKHRPEIKLRLPYFAITENNRPIWPSLPLHPYFASTLSWEIDHSPFALVLLSPFQTELDVTLSLGNALFKLFDPYFTDSHLPKSEFLHGSWLDFRALVFEIQLWQLMRNYVEPNKISGYRYQDFKTLWGELQNKDYFSIFAWMLQQRQSRYKIQSMDYYLIAPQFKGKSPVDGPKTNPSQMAQSAGIISSLFPQNSGFLGAFHWPQFFSKDSPYDGLIIAAELQSKPPEGDQLINQAIVEMTKYIQIDNPNFHSEDAKGIFEHFLRQLGPAAIEIPKNLSDNMNIGLKGDY